MVTKKDKKEPPAEEFVTAMHYCLTCTNNWFAMRYIDDSELNSMAGEAVALAWYNFDPDKVVSTDLHWWLVWAGWRNMRSLLKAHIKWKKQFRGLLPEMLKQLSYRERRYKPSRIMKQDRRGVLMNALASMSDEDRFISWRICRGDTLEMIGNKVGLSGQSIHNRLHNYISQNKYIKKLKEWSDL